MDREDFTLVGGVFLGIAILFASVKHEINVGERASDAAKNEASYARVEAAVICAKDAFDPAAGDVFKVCVDRHNAQPAPQAPADLGNNLLNWLVQILGVSGLVGSVLSGKSLQIKHRHYEPSGLIHENPEASLTHPRAGHCDHDHNHGHAHGHNQLAPSGP